MEQGYKHFSHSHNLIMHQMPESVEVSCSGCNSSGTGTVNVCWQCNFFLHEQCYRATRSLKHPSHPLHPLTLVPYPTYPSNSFYCNSCEIMGTGFSYSCADCEFDLHVQCAFSITGATSFQQAHQYPTTYYNPNHELVPPGWNGQNSNMAQNAGFVSVPSIPPNSFNGAQNSYMAQIAHSVTIPKPTTGAQYSSTAQNLAYASIPTGCQNLVATAHDPSMAQNGSSVFIPTSSPNPITSAQYPSMAQTGPSVFIPTSSPNPITTAQNPSTAQGVTSSLVTKYQYPITRVQNSNMAQNAASVSIPASSPSNHLENHVESGQNRLKDQGIKHFSHPHGLLVVNLQDGENQVACSGCEITLVGKGYSCVEPKCDFHLYESCFHLKKEIRHESHPDHPLTLLSSAPYNNKNGEFTCNACFSGGTGFTYHCSICKFDLHIQCVNLPETVKRSDHKHALKLMYSCPVKGEEYTVSCDVCHGVIQKDRWMYLCEACNYGTHLGCVDCEKCDKASALDVQLQMQRLQLEMEMARQNAQMIASMGASLASLV